MAENKKARNDAEFFKIESKVSLEESQLKRKFGAEGFAMYYGIRQQLCGTDYHYIDVSDEDNFEELAIHCCVDVEKLTTFMNWVAKKNTDTFSETLWKQRVIYSPNLIEFLTTLYSKRVNSPLSEKEVELRIEKEREVENSEDEEKYSTVNGSKVEVSTGEVVESSRVEEGKIQNDGNLNLPESDNFGLNQEEEEYDDYENQFENNN